MTWIDWHKESKLVDDVRIGLEGALHEVELNLDEHEFTGITGFYDANIKINKFVYMVINHFDIPILTTWFRYGQYEPHDEFSPVNIQPQHITEQTQSPRTPSIKNRNYPSPDEIQSYLLSTDLKNLARMEMFEFMEQNYDIFAPSDLKNAYLANLNILKILEEINKDPHPEDRASEYYDRVKKNSVTLRKELYVNDLFEPKVEDYVELGLHTLQGAIQDLLTVTNGIGNDQRKNLVSLRWTYHERVWRWPALFISRREAKGAEVETFIDGWWKEANEADLMYPRHLKEIRKTFFEKGYFPNPVELKPMKTNMDNSVRDLRLAILE